MKKITTVLLGLSSLVFGSSDEYAVYEKKCASCHLENISKVEFIKNISKMKAPPMGEVANQRNPLALEHFDVMPSQKGKLTETQKQAIAEWTYDRYEGVEFQ